MTTLTPEEQRALVERVRKWADAELIDDSSVLSYWRVEGILKVCDIAASATKRAKKFKAERDAANERAERMEKDGTKKCHLTGQPCDSAECHHDGCELQRHRNGSNSQ